MNASFSGRLPSDYFQDFNALRVQNTQVGCGTREVIFVDAF